MIIIEGPDNSGKSTLAQALKEQSLINEVWHAGGPGFNPERLRDELWRVATNLTVAHDRANFISGPIYERAFNNAQLNYDINLCKANVEYMLKHKLVFIIYCKGHGPFTAREAESEEYNNKVKAVDSQLRFAYNDFFENLLRRYDNCVSYDFNHGESELAKVLEKLRSFQTELFSLRQEFQETSYE